jgi:predicted transcriptional regulator YdeE
MNPKIVTEKECLVVGMSFYGDPFSQASGWSEDNEIGLLWKRFMASDFAAIKHRTAPDTFLEIHIETRETAAKGIYEVFVGTRVHKLEDVPIEYVVKVLPAAQYAVFTLVGQQIVSDWSNALRDWMASSGYVRLHQYFIQSYDSRFKGMDRIDESVLDAYIPIMRSSVGEGT